MISLEAKENLENLDQRSAIDLICVIDVSGSMNGQGKLELVKDTLH
jgi:Mg-chelatase subunit ChlD